MRTTRRRSAAWRPHRGSGRRAAGRAAPAAADGRNGAWAAGGWAGRGPTRLEESPAGRPHRPCRAPCTARTAIIRRGDEREQRLVNPWMQDRFVANWPGSRLARAPAGRQIAGMCGRGAQHSDPETIARRFGVVGPLPNLQARYNAAPLQEIGVVRRNPKSGQRALDALVWGLVPHWSKTAKPGFSTINAKSETVATAPAFREAWQAGRRCLVPFDLFFEWQKRPDGGKQPYAIAGIDRAPLGIAGLWESKRLDDGAVLRTFTILTTAANALMAPLHDRMPVII